MVRDLRKTRRELDLTLEELSKYTGISIPLIRKWERTGDVPRAERETIEWAVWAIRSNRALEDSGLPECEWKVEKESVPDGKALEEHYENCEVCAMRQAYIEEHVGPQPGGLLEAIVYRVAQWPDWLQSAAAGVGVLILCAGIGVVGLLGVGLVRTDLQYIVMAMGLLGVLVVTGGVAGIIYHLTRGLREKSMLGHYVSSVLTVYGYVAALVALVALAIAVAGREAVGEDLYELVAEPLGWGIMLVTGVFFGLALGKGLRSAE